MYDVIYEDIRKVGTILVRAINQPRDVFALTRATYDTVSGQVSVEHRAVVLESDALSATSRLPQPEVKHSDTGRKMRAIRVAVLAACAWEAKVAHRLQVLADDVDEGWEASS